MKLSVFSLSYLKVFVISFWFNKWKSPVLPNFDVDDDEDEELDGLVLMKKSKENGDSSLRMTWSFTPTLP